MATLETQARIRHERGGLIGRAKVRLCETEPDLMVRLDLAYHALERPWRLSTVVA
jgi:hypothetical protein